MGNILKWSVSLWLSTAFCPPPPSAAVRSVNCGWNIDLTPVSLPPISYTSSAFVACLWRKGELHARMCPCSSYCCMWWPSDSCKIPNLLSYSELNSMDKGSWSFSISRHLVRNQNGSWCLGNESVKRRKSAFSAYYLQKNKIQTAVEMESL